MISCAAFEKSEGFPVSPILSSLTSIGVLTAPSSAPPSAFCFLVGAPLSASSAG